MDFQALFLSPSGRIGRQEFWIGFLILFAAGFVLAWIPFLNFVFHIVAIYFWVCLYAKRLHDMGKSGFLVIIPYAVSFFAVLAAVVMGGMAFFTSAASGNEHADTGATVATLGGAFLALGVAGLVGLIFLLWVGITPSDVGDNRYGPPAHLHGSVPPLGAGPTPEAPAAPPAPPPTPPSVEPPSV